MRIFHLADLHLGKTLHEHDLMEDQRHALNAIVDAARTERPACCLIAGDVFDRAVPPADAVTLLGTFVSRLKEIDPAMTVAIIPGNHDSAARLAFLAPILTGVGVHVASDPATCDVPVIIEHGGERARLWLLPFLNPGSFETEPAPRAAVAQGSLFDEQPALLRSQADMFAEAMRRIEASKGPMRTSDDTADILLCHAFAAGGLPSESERAFLGTAELVDGSAFNCFDYAALGHLHRPQSVGQMGRYPGSPLAYSFSEAGGERGFLSVEVRRGSMLPEFRPIVPLHRMIRIEGSYDEVLNNPDFSRYADDYVEAVLADANAVLNPVDAIRKRFPWLLSLRQAAFERDDTSVPGANTIARTTTSAVEDFAAFYRELRGADPDSEEAALFAELYTEADSEAR
ncbi:MAG TPA: exonuclease SbcCD subunit D [bacterium]|nr:exonuclease SbcCD subunit D [bacterium]